jgi:hypothetical protein
MSRLNIERCPRHWGRAGRPPGRLPIIDEGARAYNAKALNLQGFCAVSPGIGEGWRGYSKGVVSR